MQPLLLCISAAAVSLAPYRSSFHFHSRAHSSSFSLSLSNGETRRFRAFPENPASQGKPGYLAVWRPCLQTLISATPKASTKYPKPYPLYRGTILIRYRPSTQEHHRSLDTVLLYGPMGWRFIICEVTLHPLYPSISSGCRCSLRNDSNAKPNLKQDPVLIDLISHPEPRRLSFSDPLQGYLAHKNLHPPRTLQ